MGVSIYLRVKFPPKHMLCIDAGRILWNLARPLDRIGSGERQRSSLMRPNVDTMPISLFYSQSARPMEFACQSENDAYLFKKHFLVVSTVERLLLARQARHFAITLLLTLAALLTGLSRGY